MKKISIIIFFLLFVGINAYSKNGVSQRDLNMINMAFMNGAVELTRLDIDQIQELKNNENLLREKVYALTGDYIKKVLILNSVEKVKPTHIYLE